MGNFTPPAHPLAYEDYVHVETRRYAMIPVNVNPETGERVALVTPPPGYVPASNQAPSYRSLSDSVR